jgi:nucleoside-diphosphate-sugar epimerase
MSPASEHPLAEDLAHVLEHTRDLWESLRGARILVTGGSGFFGKWLLESFLWADGALGLDAKAVALTRDPAAFARNAPRLAAHPSLSLHRGDQVDFAFPAGPFDAVLHTAVEYGSPLETFERNLLGTRGVLAFARAAGAGRFLLASSGAVYGPQPRSLDRLPEGHPGSPDLADPASAYGLAKRASEHLGHLQPGIELKIARGFAFVGPYLPLDRTGAMGNFLGDALGGGPIRVAGDGTPLRSYLYAADLAIWLWTILLKGRPGRPYNAGGPEAVSIRELAERVAAAVSPGAEIRIAQAVEPGPPARYLPDVTRAREELGLEAWIPLDEALRRTARHLRSQPFPRRIGA